MNHTELNTFLLVANCGSFSKAAKKLYISKNAVMQQINTLEDSLDLTLFIRTTHGVKLTNAGRALINKATQLNNLTKEIYLSLTKYKNTIFAGSGFLNLPTVIKRKWSEFAINHEQSKLSFIEIKNYENIPQEIDLFEGIYSERPFSRQGFDFIQYQSVPLVAAIYPNSSLKALTRLKLNDLANKTISIPNSTIFKSMKSTRQILNKNVTNCRIKEYTALNTAVINNAQIMHEILIIPQSLCYLLDNNLIKPVQWNLTLNYGFYYRRDASNLSKEFLKYMKRERIVK
ncbi:LysR family transcriptional regulator [Lactobacillus ultunensis]|uniref:Transcriptional regulator, LysR family n=1 Tax=Lactobacillus ultunensis DSM 16047 TaxID=525365 RepID=C2ELG8_9LACO|nr:LysR family transcriptional regulator [Lactobacillus ultunensis]EEJ72616.1 transcriptional regulator, LysR family [Lactobacillus ultunensis DSM 16047]KRL81241.1 transcriptional regulator [Lactobacillus ultunensis DSM 16047]QQP28186.1 LysR family transcriptional regulator [Lactobacillus ultunensis]